MHAPEAEETVAEEPPEVRGYVPPEPIFVEPPQQALETEPGLETLVGDFGPADADAPSLTLAQSVLPEALEGEGLEGVLQAAATVELNEENRQSAQGSELALPDPEAQGDLLAIRSDELPASGEEEAAASSSEPIAAGSFTGGLRGTSTAAPSRPAVRYGPRRKSGGIRELIGVAVSGLLAMGLVYYFFNLIGGAKYDFFKFPLPGVRHTYKHLAKYPWMPRFGIEPAGKSGGQPKGDAKEPEGAPEEPKEPEIAAPADSPPLEEESSKVAPPVKKDVPKAASPKPNNKKAPAKKGKEDAKKGKQELPFDLTPDPRDDLTEKDAMTP